MCKQHSAMKKKEIKFFFLKKQQQQNSVLPDALMFVLIMKTH